MKGSWQSPKTSDLFWNRAVYQTLQYLKTDSENYAIKKILLDLEETEIKNASILTA